MHELILFAHHAAAEARGSSRVVILPKSIREKVSHRYLLLPHQAAPRQLTGGMQIQNGTHTGRRCNLNRAPHFIANPLMINLTGITLLDQQPLAPARHGAKRDYNILKRYWHGALQNVLKLLAMLA